MAKCRNGYSWLIVTAALLLPGCEAYDPPALTVAPTNPTVSTVATRIVLTAGSRADQQLDVSANVLSADGHGVPNVSVAFTIGAGTVSPTTVMTDQFGMAYTIAVSTGVTEIAATIGAGITSSVNVLPSPQL
jgi:hypothetical protein